MRFTVYIALLTFLSCAESSRQLSPPLKIVDLIPDGLDSIEYINQQSQLRQYVLSSYIPSEDFAMWKYIGNKKLSIFYTQDCLHDSSLVVPAAFNLDNRVDFITHNFASTLTCTLSKDTLLNFNITKDYFMDQLDSNLKRFGVLRNPGGTLSADSDSIEIIFQVTIPATLFKKQFIFKTDYSCNFMIREDDLPKGYVR